MSLALFDFHCDTAYKLLGNDLQQRYSLYENPFHIDLKRTSSFSNYVQCFACYTNPIEPLPKGITPEDVFNLEYAGIIAELNANSEIIQLTRSAGDIRKNVDAGIMSAFLSLEGTAGINYDPAALEELYQKGFRITTLGWNEQNPLTGSHSTGGGLTDRGREYVREAQRLHMIVDVSHISDDGFWDIMNITCNPVIASHSNSRSVHPVSRNLTDDMFTAICQTGGVAGINLYSQFLGRNATIDTVCDHIFHFLALDPTGKHIALGGDLDGCDNLPSGFTGVESYTILAERLIQRGVPQNTVNDIFWNNAIGVIERCCT